MKVKTMVRFEQEVEVEVDMDDIIAAIGDFPEGQDLPWILSGVTRVHSFLRRVSDEQIAAMNDRQKAIIRDALVAQAIRFGAPAPTPVFKPGDRVRYHPIIGEGHDGKHYIVRELGELGPHQVAWLDGKNGAVAIEALSPAPWGVP